MKPVACGTLSGVLASPALITYPTPLCAQSARLEKVPSFNAGEFMRSSLTFLAKVLSIVVSTLFTLIVIELLVRAANGTPVLAWQDWRTVNVRDLQPSSIYDATVGWLQKPHIISPDLNTIEHGIRKNSNREEAPDQSAILAVGDSFVVGGEVKDAEAWPAHLERTTGLRVLNAGVNGYGVDQTGLNAERLLPVLKPKLVLVGILADDITRSRYRVRIAPKPYFSQENGVWDLRNVPVPRRVQSRPETIGKALLAHSYALHRLMLKREDFRDFWFTGSGLTFDVAHNDGAGASCHALSRLAPRLAAAGAPGLVVMQYEGWHHVDGKRPADVEKVLACARSNGFGIVDQFDRLTSVARASTDQLKSYYMMHAKWSFGHMSPAGNAVVGALVAEHLKTAPELTRGVAQVPGRTR